MKNISGLTDTYNASYYPEPGLYHVTDENQVVYVDKNNLMVLLIDNYNSFMMNTNTEKEVEKKQDLITSDLFLKTIALIKSDVKTNVIDIFPDNSQPNK